MDPDDDIEDEEPRLPWLPPEDRLWRHPSEMASFAASTSSDAPASPSALQRDKSIDIRDRKLAVEKTWLISVTAGLVGAMVSAALTFAVVTHHQQVSGYTTQMVSAPSVPVTASDSTFHLQGPSLLDTVMPSIIALNVDGDAGTQTASGVMFMNQGGYTYALTDSQMFLNEGDDASINVQVSGSPTIRGQLVGVDNAAGVAVVRLRASGEHLAALGSVADLQTGDTVIAMGSPMAIQSGLFYSTGTVNDIDHYVLATDGSPSSLFGMILTDAPVDSGSFGGALVNTDGAVVGITNPAKSGGPSAVTYATPIDEAVSAGKTLVANHGRPATHAWLGALDAADLPAPVAHQLGVLGGVQVQVVVPGSPAAKAGMANGDIVTAADNKPVTSTGSLLALLANEQPGEQLQIGWLHAGSREQATVHLTSQPSELNQMAASVSSN